MAQVEVEPGVRLYIEDWGSGPPVVFIHGGGVTHEFWEHQVPSLMDRFRVITYDLRGCGRSDRPPQGYTPDRWADDLRGLVEGLELERPVIVGHAVGSHVALRFAIRHAATLDSLVLASAAPWFLGERESTGGFSQAMWEKMKATLTRNRPQAELDLADERYFHRDPGEGMRLATLHMALQWALPVYVQMFESFADLDHREDLPGLDLPVLVAHGRHDTKNRYDGGEYLAEALPNARLVTFEESAHCPPLEEPERFNEELLGFLLKRTAERTPAALAS